MKKITETNKVSNYNNYGVDVDNLEIKLFSEINYETADTFIWGLNLLFTNSQEKRSYKPIIIHMSTPGGDEVPGMAIHDAIKALPNHTTIINYGEASSMGSIILQSATKRIMMPNSLFMFHMGDLTIEGTRKQIKSFLEFDKGCDETMLEIYASRMRQSGKFKGSSKTKIKEYLNRQMDNKEDVFLTASQTVSHGLADDVFTSWRSVRGR